MTPRPRDSCLSAARDVDEEITAEGGFALPPFDEEDEEEGPLLWIICAFCLITSAGVRTRHDAHSAMDEASECTSG